MSAGQYVDHVRVEAVKVMLESGDEGLATIAKRTGFGTVETMRRAFLRDVGTSPGAYRERFRHQQRPRPVQSSRPLVWWRRIGWQYRLLSRRVGEPHRLAFEGSGEWLAGYAAGGRNAGAIMFPPGLIAGTTPRAASASASSSKMWVFTCRGDGLAAESRRAGVGPAARRSSRWSTASEPSRFPLPLTVDSRQRAGRRCRLTLREPGR
jgi:Helix-turn-helix domain